VVAAAAECAVCEAGTVTVTFGISDNCNSINSTGNRCCSLGLETTGYQPKLALVLVMAMSMSIKIFRRS